MHAAFHDRETEPKVALAIVIEADLPTTNSTKSAAAPAAVTKLARGRLVPPPAMEP